MSYIIAVYCSSSHKELLDINLSSWVNSSAEEVFVYSDGLDSQNYQHKKLSVINNFSIDKNLSINYRRKVEMLANLRIVGETRNIVMLDADCYVVGNFDNLFNKKFDIAVSIKDNIDINNPYNNVSAGFVAIQKSRESNLFLLEWLRQQQQNKRSKVADQIGLSNTLKSLYNKSQASLCPVTEMEYNFYPEHNSPLCISKWLKKIESNMKIIKNIHFAFGLWKNKELRKYVQSFYGANNV